MKKYTKEQILIAAEIGEVSMIDARHIVSLLDEAVILERERKLRKHKVIRRFSYDAKGYSAAQTWLKEIGEWERVSSSGFSTDGWSIVETANVIWEKRNGG